MNLLSRMGAGLALAWWLSVLLTAGASAHAEPQTVYPGNLSVLQRAPDRIEIYFSQNVARREDESKIELLDETGRVLTLEPAVVDEANRRRMTVAVPSDLEPGQYEIAWQTRSADDGELTGGSLFFTIDPSASFDPGQETLIDERQPSVQAPTPAVTPLPDKGLSSAAVAGIVGVGVFLAAQFGVVYWVRARRRA